MLWWIAETTLVAATLAAVAALAPRLRPLGPAARHALWLLVLLKLVTPPVLSWPWPGPRPPLPDRAPIARASAEAIAEVGPPRRIAGGEAPEPLGATGDVRPRPEPSPAGRRGITLEADVLGRWALVAWALVSATLAAGQVAQIVRFRRRLRGAEPAPAWLVAEAGPIAERLGVAVPEALAVPGLAAPLLWCLGRPKLLLPSRLVGTLGVARWRGILAHELAHLRRGDPWVRRLALVAGWAWWWNPLYWIARRRLDAEAEIACDAWVVWALPGDRVVYAETLLDICASLSPETTPSRAPAPALGVTSSGRFFERRLTMILRDRVPCRLSPPALLGAGLLMLLALPSWTVARSPADRDRPADAIDPVRLVAASTATDRADVALADDDDDDDDDERDKSRGPASKPKDKDRKGEKDATAPRDARDEDDDRDEAKGRGKARIEIDLSGLEKMFGPDSGFLKAIEAIARDIEEAVEKKLGPGSDFEAKIKGLGKDLEKKLGPGSDFEARMKDLVGPGSDFEARMKDLERELEKVGPDSDFDVKEIKVIADILNRLQKQYVEDMKKARPAPDVDKRVKSKAKAGVKDRPDIDSSGKAPARTDRADRHRRIKELESKLDQIRDELRRLKAEEDEENDRPAKRS